MAINSHYAEEVRRVALGIDNRDPISDGLDCGKTAVDSFQNHAGTKMTEAVNDGTRDLEKAMTSAEFRLDATNIHGKGCLNETLEDGEKRFRKSVKRGERKLAPVYPNAHEKLIPIDDKCEERVIQMTVRALSEKEGYYQLSFMRSNRR